MRILGIGVLILFLISGYLNADESLTNADKITLNLNTKQKILVQAFIDPVEFTRYNSHTQWDTLANLKVAVPEKLHTSSVFRALIPNHPVSVGELWKIESQGGILGFLAPWNFETPRIIELLKQLHPNPRMISGHTKGMWACLRAYNTEFAEIVFRIHAEFRIENDLFTPSQFAGKLVLDRKDGSIAFFEMRVPEGTVNFDFSMNEKNNDTFSTDSGFCPRMELLAGTYNTDVEFEVSITQEEAKRILAEQFYGFLQINWLPLDEALEMAKTLRKPIHALSISGPLDNEAC